MEDKDLLRLREPGFSPQQPQGSSQPSVISVPGPSTLSGQWYTDIHAGKNTHKVKLDQSLKKKTKTRKTSRED